MGGLNATHLTSFIYSLKCTWVKRYLLTSYAPWKHFFDYYLKNYGGSLLFYCNYNTKDVNNLFINDICSAWSHYDFYILTHSLRNEIIWNIDGDIIYYDFLRLKGVNKVKDLFDYHNCILSFQ